MISNITYTIPNTKYMSKNTYSEDLTSAYQNSVKAWACLFVIECFSLGFAKYDVGSAWRFGQKTSEGHNTSGPLFLTCQWLGVVWNEPRRGMTWSNAVVEPAALMWCDFSLLVTQPPLSVCNLGVGVNVTLTLLSSETSDNLNATSVLGKNQSGSQYVLI